MRAEVLRCIRENSLLAPGDRVICAVSGGADSMAMLCVMLSLREELQLRIEAAHFNHLLRGAESDGDEVFVREFCEKQDIPFHCGRGDVSAYSRETGCSIEDSARQLRYRFLETLGGTIATAHTADDNAETLLMHLLRGSGLDGLCGIPPRRGSIIRPLLYVTHRECEAYLTAAQLPWREDSSNREDDCLRNRLRHGVMPLLKRENPEFARAARTASALLRDDRDYLEQQAALLLQSAECTGGYRCSVLAQAHDALLRRALRQLFASDALHTDALSEIVRNGNGTVKLPGGTTAVCSCGTLLLSSEAPDAIPETELPIGGECIAGKLRFTCTVETAPESFGDGSVWLRLPRDGAVISVRSRREGDSLRLRCGTVTVKKLLIDRKIPVSLRPAVPIVCVDGQIAAAAGVRTGADHFAEPGTPAVHIVIHSGEDA